MRRWYVVNTQPRAEARAAQHLKNQGYRVLLPLFRKTRRHARRIDTVMAPLFPGYFFVNMDIENEPWAAINGTRGVVKLLNQQGLPTPLTDAFIEPFAATMDEEGCLSLPEQELSPGQPLRITGGPYQEYIGKLVELPSRDRVTLMLHAFGRDVTATVAKEFVIPA